MDLISAMKLAAQEAARYQCNSPVPVVDKKFDGGTGADLVTEVDRKSEAIIKAVLHHHFPEWGFVGEEFGGEAREHTFLVDPLDGTKAFIEGREDYGPIIGAFHHDQNIAGIVYNSATGEHYTAADNWFTQSKVPPRQKLVYLQGGKLTSNLIEEVQAHFPGHTVLVNEGSVNHRARVHAGSWTAYFHTNLAYHDIAADIIFGRNSETMFTDHRGMPYERR